MTLGELKRIAQRLGGVLVLNNDKPDFIILAYHKYRELESGLVETQTSSSSEDFVAGANGTQESQTIDWLNREILALKEEIRQKEEAELASSEGSEK